MATITAREARQIAQANASGRAPVVFIHGLWLLPSSWDSWAGLFEEAGYAAVAPSWPDDPETVEEARANPDVFARKTVGQVADHVAEAIGELDHTVPWAIANAAYKKQRRNESVTEIVEIPNRGHSLTIDSGWREVADTALAFVKRFV